MAACCPPKQNAPKKQLIQAMAGWMIPGFGWFLIPKCPLCLAAYFSIATGFAMPITLRAVFIRS